ncbi:MAG: hypothetical protein ABSA09_10615 [Desulfobaccales bacterium]|jgi:uncharacterized integral membrane protein
MNRFKTVLFVILIVILLDFALENGASTQELKLFRFSLGQVPIFLLAYASVAVGLVLGWMGHVFRVINKRRRAAWASAQEKQAPPGPQPQDPAR